MLKAEFISILEKEMADISQLEKERILNYYNETLEDAMEDGIDEEGAVASLGSIEIVVKQIKTEHETETISAAKHGYQLPYGRYILLFLTSPFWMLAVYLVIICYLLYLTALLCIAVLILSLIIFLLAGCIHVFAIIMANFASGVLLLGCMLTSLGILPWSYYLLRRGIDYAKVLYHKGIETGRVYWQKAVA